MKKIFILFAIGAAGFAFYEQSKPNPNVWITVIAIIIFMLGIMLVSSKTPSKNQNNDTDDIQ